MARMSPTTCLLTFALCYLAVALHAASPTSASGSEHDGKLKLDHTSGRGLHPSSSSSSSLKASPLAGNHSGDEGRSLGRNDVSSDISDDVINAMGAASAKGSNSGFSASGQVTWEGAGSSSLSSAAESEEENKEEGDDEENDEKPGLLFTSAGVSDVDGAAPSSSNGDEGRERLKGGAGAAAADPYHQQDRRTLSFSPRPSLRERRSTAPWYTVSLLPAGQTMSGARRPYGGAKAEREREAEALHGRNKGRQAHLGSLGKSWGINDDDDVREEEEEEEEEEAKLVEAEEEAERERERMNAAAAASAASAGTGGVGGGRYGAGGEGGRLRAYPVRNPFPAVMPFLKPPRAAKRHTGRLSINGALSSLADMLMAESFRREGSSMRSGLHNAGRRR